MPITKIHILPTATRRTILDVAGEPEQISQKSGASYDKIYVMKLGSQVFKLEDVGGYLGTGQEMSNELWTVMNLTVMNLTFRCCSSTRVANVTKEWNFI